MASSAQWSAARTNVHSVRQSAAAAAAQRSDLNLTEGALKAVQCQKFNLTTKLQLSKSLRLLALLSQLFSGASNLYFTQMIVHILK